MKKSLLAVAALGALYGASAMAQSSVTVTGIVDTGIGSFKGAGDTSSKSMMVDGGMSTSFFGLAGKEELGGGMKAEFNLGAFLRPSTGAVGRFNGDTMFARDANVGLSGSFGKVQLGRGLAPSFLPTVIFNPFGDSFTYSPLVLHTYTNPVSSVANAFAFSASPNVSGTPFNQSDSGWSNEIIYSTPNFKGFTANVHYQMGGIAGQAGKSNYGANFLYFNGPLAIGGYASSTQINNPASTSTLAGLMPKQTAYSGAVSYDFSVVKLYGTYLRSSNDDANSTLDKIFSLGASAPLGNGSAMLAWANTKRTATGVDAKWDTISAGYDYNLSKRTDLYAAYMYEKITNLTSGNSFGVGVRHKF